MRNLHREEYENTLRGLFIVFSEQCFTMRDFTMNFI